MSHGLTRSGISVFASAATFYVALILSVIVPLGNASIADDQPEQPSSLPDAVLGEADAPVTVIEYSSLGCPHCADFHAEVMPDIRTTFIETGKVRWIIRDFPLSSLSLAGAVVARCAGPEGYPALIKALFRTQDSWMTSEDPLGDLETLAGKAGIDRSEFEACLNNQDLITAIINASSDAHREYQIEGTPSFIVNGEKIVGYVGFEKMKTVLERHGSDRTQ